MTYTTYDASGSPGSSADAAEALRTAASAAGRGLPAAGAVLAHDPRPISAAVDLLAAPGAQVVSVPVHGAATGRVALVVPDAVAATLCSGPLGADELAAALATPLTDAVAELGAAYDGGLDVGVADAIVAEAADFAPGAFAVPLTDGDAPLGVLVVDLLAGAAEPAAEAASFTSLVEESAPPAARPLDLLHDVEMAVTVELGRTRMAVRDLLSLAPGAVVELDRAAGSPVDVLVNGKLIARGEVVVVDDDFGIRISEIIGLQASAT